MMAVHKLSSIDDKPDCFAIPERFHLVSPKCEHCSSQVDCGLALEKLAEAIESNGIAYAEKLRAKAPLISRHLDYWDTRPSNIAIDIAPELLERLAVRATEFDPDGHGAVAAPANCRVADACPSVIVMKGHSAHFPHGHRDSTNVSRTANGSSGRAASAFHRMPAAGADVPPDASDSTSSPAGLRVPTAAPVTLRPTAPGGTSASSAHYAFDGTGDHSAFSLMSDQELEAAHTEICERTYSRSASPVSYMTVRGDYCAASIVMNERGLRPPRFREACQGAAWSRAVVWTEDLKAMSSDMKVIDLHWLHRAGIRSSVDDYEFSDLLARDDFDFDLAAGFVATRWKTEARVGKILALADAEQWQLKKLSSAAINALWKNVLSEARVIEQRLKSAAWRRPHLLPDIQDHKRLWIADTICGGKNQNLIGLVHGWQKGALPLAASTLSSKLKTMRRRTKAS